MDFEEWWDKEDSMYVEDLARAAWGAGYRQAYSDAYADAAYPTGYVLVPVEPTAKMLEAGEDPYDCLILSEIYQAMIRAAQEKE